MLNILSTFVHINIILYMSVLQDELLCYEEGENSIQFTGIVSWLEITNKVKNKYEK